MGRVGWVWIESGSDTEEPAPGPPQQVSGTGSAAWREVEAGDGALGSPLPDCATRGLRKPEGREDWLRVEIWVTRFRELEASSGKVEGWSSRSLWPSALP